jgi:secreted Zn-dependent insulinase-like peptidase
MSDVNNILKKFSKYVESEGGVFKSLYDKSRFRYFRLKNKLQIFFIENIDSNMSSASMLVDVGNIDNPIGIDGMAHYLEHMLFMGSDLYPGTTYFQSQVSNNSGMTNAFTTDTNTRYFFNSNGENFLELLKIFSRFFIKPLFDIEYVEKEVSAVDSEHKKNIGSDGWRIINLSKQFLIEGVNTRFSTGTKDSLLGACGNNPKTLKHKLTEFYDNFYSSDKMTLFISHAKIDDIIPNVLKIFEQIPFKNTLVTHDIAKVRLFKDMYELIKVKTVNESDSLIIHWLVDGTEKCVNNTITTCFDILSYILGNETNGSIYHILTKLELITQLTIGVERNFETNSLLTMDLSLTQKGYENWESILYIIQGYVRNIVNNDKIKEIFDNFLEEMDRLTLLRLKTLDISDSLQLTQYYTDIYDKKRVDLQYLPVVQLLIGNKDIIYNHFINTLNSCTMDNMKVIIASSSFEKNDVPMTDKYYGTMYNLLKVPISGTVMNKYNKLFNESDSRASYYPDLNRYIPVIDNLEIINTISTDNHVIASSFCRLYSTVDNIYYVKRGNTFNTHNLSIILSIDLVSMIGQVNEPKINIDAYVLILLYILYMSRVKTSDSYMLQVAGISIDLVIDTFKLGISANGCIECIDNVFATVMDWFFVPDGNNIIDIDTYKMTYYELMTGLIDWQYSDSYTMIGAYFKKMINNNYMISNEELILALEKINPTKMNDVGNNINYSNYRKTVIDYISVGDIVGVFSGSINIKQIFKIIRKIDNIIKKPSDGKKTSKIKYVLDKSKLSSKEIKYSINPNNHEKAIGYGLYVGNMRETITKFNWNDEKSLWMINKPFCMMLESYISEKFSTLIRTEKEVGYVTLCNMINVSETNNPEIFLLFVVQSSKNDLESIIEDYVDNHMMNDINLITDSEFEKMKQSVITKLLEKSPNIYSDALEKYFVIINSEYVAETTNTNTNPNICVADFMSEYNRKKLMCNVLKSVKKKELFTLFVKNIVNNGVRSTILIMPK